MKAGRVRHLPSYCNEVLEVFASFKFNLLAKYEKRVVAKYIKQEVFCTLASARHVGANLVMEEWQSLNGVARTLGHQSEGTSLFYLDAWKAQVDPANLSRVAAQQMKARFHHV